MNNDDRPATVAGWVALSALTPLYVFSTSLSIGLSLGMAFLVVHSVAAVIALLLPVAFGRGRIFAFSVLGAALATSLCASLIRLLDPLLFESAYWRLFLLAFTIPVLRASIIPDTIAERERAWENVIRGIGYAASVILVGAVREFLASGAISINTRLVSTTLLPVAAQPVGALILLGLAAAGFKALMSTAKGEGR